MKENSKVIQCVYSRLRFANLGHVDNQESAKSKVETLSGN